jgi:release factor glutamine methyltransferase
MAEAINDFYKNIVLKLKAVYPDEEASAIADRLFENYLGVTPVQRIVKGSKPIDAGKIPFIERAVSNLLNYVPLQYVLGIAHFLDLEFEVNPSVLIPRPETEELVSLILKKHSILAYDGKLQIIDIGTGSGCIAISLKHYIPLSTVAAIDSSLEAISVATANAKRNGVDIEFIQADILDKSQWDSLPACDLIVSNPPYVTHAEKQFMQRNVLDFEPHSALFVPDNDPLIFYRLIFAFAKLKLSNNGSLWFEINEMFGADLRELAINQGFKEANIIFDIRGKSRFLQCSK